MLKFSTFSAVAVLLVLASKLFGVLVVFYCMQQAWGMMWLEVLYSYAALGLSGIFSLLSWQEWQKMGVK